MTDTIIVEPISITEIPPRRFSKTMRLIALGTAVAVLGGVTLLLVDRSGTTDDE
jgi:hypothetical protein